MQPHNDETNDGMPFASWEKKLLARYAVIVLLKEQQNTESSRVADCRLYSGET